MIFKRTTRMGVPFASLAFTSLFEALAYTKGSRSSWQFFQYLGSLVTMFGALNWTNILVTYVQFI